MKQGKGNFDVIWKIVWFAHHSIKKGFGFNLQKPEKQDLPEKLYLKR